MKKLLLIGTGVGIGYVLGARAGRPAYDRIVETTRSFGSSIGLDRTRQATRDVVDEAKHAGEQLRDKADSRIADTVDKVGSVLPTQESAGTSPTASDDVVTLPGPTTKVETRASDMANGF
jgi:hypothetical protein